MPIYKTRSSDDRDGCARHATVTTHKGFARIQSGAASTMELPAEAF